MISMKYIDFVKRYWLHITFVVLIVVFSFVYFVVYRTERRAAWYQTMFTQTQDMVTELRDAAGLEN